MMIPHDWFAPATCPEPRASVRHLRDRGAWHTGLRLRLAAYDGAVLEAELEVPGHWWRVSLRLWYSQAMLRRSWDRWHAEQLAGDHRGISLTITPEET
jgi:hypothetical protein